MGQGERRCKMSKKMHALEDDKWLCNECKHFGGLVFKWGTATTCKGKAIIKLKKKCDKFEKR